MNSQEKDSLLFTIKKPGTIGQKDGPHKKVSKIFWKNIREESSVINKEVLKNRIQWEITTN